MDDFEGAVKDNKKEKTCSVLQCDQKVIAGDMCPHHHLDYKISIGECFVTQCHSKIVNGSKYFCTEHFDAAFKRRAKVN